MVKRSALPGFGLSLGLTLSYLTIIVLLPLAALVLKAVQMGPAELLAVVSGPRALASYRVTLTMAAAATLFSGLYGLLLAWILVRYDFPGRRFLDALVDLPFALPTAVAGLALTELFARNGWFGSLLSPLGIEVAYAPAGIAVAMAFTSFPFVVRTVQPVLEDLEADAEEAARMLGAGDWQIFARVILPMVLPAWVAGCALGFARSLGEFGAVVFIAGNLPFETEVTSLLAFIRLEEFDYPSAAGLACVMLLAAFVMLTITNLLQARWLRFAERS
ncbi:MAG TPA: sulfate ABC transporter permease subunit CysT [Geminicoccus sp.]|jgi:sulfate transport system permease protein|uniref:sulfate ABC transporter permease subunit CysT n=1 Tax=Geminicoccus sp. TaxID=2024832 RepID=UPI002E364D23|nr:sulfate ABC transporter permease subunit CysT [Geminicoccus sp.]HEX2525109.1 sulfate ABC transporter permease subunit CysT [Geminicoccus sp.]